MRGKDATDLHIKYILAGRVFVNRLRGQDDFIAELRRLGFKRVVITDGYDETYTLTL